MKENMIQKLIESLQGDSESVLLVYESSTSNVFDAKYLFDMLMRHASTGTVVISGDARFSQDVYSRKGVRSLTSQQKMVLSSNKLLQLLMLEDDVSYVNHPGLFLGCKGKYGKFFSRKLPLDFPYGPDSVFKDILDLNAIVLSVGKPDYLDCLALRNGLIENPVIKKNTSIRDGELIHYLDYHQDLDALTDKIVKSNVFKSVMIGDTLVYACSYQALINLAI